MTPGAATPRAHAGDRPAAAVPLLLAALVLLSAALPARADRDEERLRSLEDKLETTLDLVEQLQAEIAGLKSALAAQQGTTPSDRQPTADDAERLQDLEERLDETEEVVSQLDERVGSRAVVRAFDAVGLDFGGFVDMAATHVEGEDGSGTSFNRQVFEILLKAELGERWDLFVAQAFVRKTGIDFSDRRNPDFGDLGSVAADTVLAWANYRHSDALNVRFGRFITPQGIINIEHFPALLLDPEQPQFLRPFIGHTIFPNFTDGVQLHGTKFLGELGQQSIQYAAYASEWAGNTTDWTYGARLAFGFHEAGLTAGLNVSAGRRVDEVDSDYVAYGADLLYDEGKLLWKTEVFATDEDLGDDRFAFYTQPAVRLDDKWTIFYRFDYLDAGDDWKTLEEIGRSREHAFGVTVRPNKNVHLRSIWTYKELDETDELPSTDAWIWQLSATLSF